MDTNMGKPDADIIVGRFALPRIYLEKASVAAPVTLQHIEGVQGFDLGAKAYQKSFEVMQYGGGDDVLEKKSDGRYSGSIQILGNLIPEFMEFILGESFSVDSMAGLPLTLPFYPLAHLEFVLREDNNSTQIFSLLVQDCIFQAPAFPLPDDVSKIDVQFTSKFDACLVANDVKVVFDKWTGDGSTTTFTPSSTPLTITSKSVQGRESWDFDTAFFVKTQASAAEFASRVKEGITITPATPVLTFTTAPAADTVVSMLYLADNTPA